MQFVYRLRQSEMRRFFIHVDYQNAFDRLSFWYGIVGWFGLGTVVGLIGNLSGRPNMFSHACIFAWVVRYLYVAARRLWLVYRSWGTVLHSVPCTMEFQQYWFASAGPPECEHKRSWREVELIERPDFLFLIKRDQHTYLLPTRVVLSDELPRLVAFIRERIEAFREPPPLDDVATAGD